MNSVIVGGATELVGTPFVDAVCERLSEAEVAALGSQVVDLAGDAETSLISFSL